MNKTTKNDKTTQDYFPRLVDTKIAQSLKNIGAISIEGCKWCGKTKTAEQFAKSVFELENPENLGILEMARSQFDLILNGEKPRLIDEWQDLPEIWDAVRYAVDKTNLPGQFILTGSATPRKKRPKHSGAGRFAIITMRPMSLFESKDSTGKVSLKDLFESKLNLATVSELSFEDLAYLCSRGGWPSSVVRPASDPLSIARNYLSTVLEREEGFANLDFYSPERMSALLRSLARNVSTPIKLTTVQKDISENLGINISDTTLSAYLATLEQIHILDSIDAWSPKLRSKTEIRTAKKRLLVDPSLAVASLFASPNDLMNDFNTFGLIFESLVLRDLRIYADVLDGDLFYFRDRAGHECDAIVHLRDGSWGAIEIKLGSDVETLDAAASSLLSFADSIDTSHTPSPKFLAIVSGKSKYAYTRPDGVFVVPITALKP